MKKLLPVYLVLILATLSCSLVDRAVDQARGIQSPEVQQKTEEAIQLPTAMSEVEVTPENEIATESAAETASPSDDVLFQDDFSDPTSGWDRVSQGENTTSDYQDGQYVITVVADQYDGWANPGQYFAGDVSVEVDANKLSGPDDNEFGVICRSQDSDNFYYFLISSDGYMGIGKAVDSEWQNLSSDKLEPFDGILQGTQTNTIRADCIGNTLSLYVNGKLAVETTDDSFSDGDVGLVAGSYKTGNVVIGFDNFVVRQP